MKSFFFFFFGILIITITISAGVNYEGYMNSTKIVIFKELSVFNTSNTEENVSFTAAGSDNSIGIYLPKNATVDSAKMNITGSVGITETDISALNTDGNSAALKVDSNDLPHIVDGEVEHLWKDSGGTWNQEEITANSCTKFYDIAITASDVIHFACGDSTGTPDTIKYFNNSGGTWTGVTIASVNDFYCTTDLNTSEDPRFACSDGNFYYKNSTGGFSAIFFDTVASDSMALDTYNDDDYVAYMNNSNVYFKNRTSYSAFSDPVTIDGDADNDGAYIDMIVNSNGDIWVSYRDGTSSHLMVANSSTGGASWDVTQIASMGDFRKTEMALDGSGYPYVIYPSSTPSTDIAIWDGSSWSTEQVDLSHNQGTIDIDSSGGAHMNARVTALFNEYYFKSTVFNDVTLDINGTIFFNQGGNFITTNTTEDFSEYLNGCLGECTADNIGYCSCNVNVSASSAGKATMNTLEINYTYNLENQTEVFNWWNVTTNFHVNDNYGVAKFYNLLQPGGTEINITGFEIDSTTCSIDGTFKTVDTSLGRNFCNITTQMSTFSWTNHTVYDGTLGTGSPANQTNATQTSSGTNQTIYFNVTGYYPNGTLSLDSGDLKMQNVTADIYLTENLYFLNISPTYGLSWYNGTLWLELNTSNKCVNGTDISEDNYSLITINNDIWRSCYDDTNDNNEIDYFKVMIPHLSNQQFLAWHEEDNDAPTITFTTPSGTYTSASDIPFNVTITDNVQVDSCFYNITNDAFGLEKATTSIDCNDFNGTFNVAGGNDDYIFTAFANDTSNNLKVSTQSFTVSISAGGSSPGGGGGGSSQASKAQNISIQAGYCGDGFCDDTIGEDPLSCSQDCVPDIFNFEKIFCQPFPECGNWEKSWFINGTIFAILGGLILLTSRTRKVKRLR